MMPLELHLVPSFVADLYKLPVADQKKVPTAIKKIQRDPLAGEGKAKRCLKQKYKNVYRYRIGNYRIIYCLAQASLKLLAIGNRKNIYDRFKADADGLLDPIGDPSSAEPQPIHTVHFDEPVSRDPVPGEDTYIPPEGTLLAEQPAQGHRLLEKLLEQWGVPEEVRQPILGCTDLEELLELDIPDKIKELVLQWHRPSTVEEIIEEPVYELPSIEELERYLDGTLRGFLLKLDPDQEKVSRRSLRGPTLVKGGPGTGKSLVALYRIRNLLQRSAQADLFGKTLPRILFVTYTKALINASEQLLEPLLGDLMKHVTVNNLDKIVRRVIAEADEPFNPASSEKKVKALEQASDLLLQNNETDKEALRQLVGRLRPGTILDEFDWVIEGRQITDMEAYLQEDRTGCGIRLDKRSRKVLWELHGGYLKALEKDGRSTWNVLRAKALQSMTKGVVTDLEPFDVVIVDEAQDLTPVGLRLCLALCKDPGGFYMTADAGQSIYQRGFSWKRVDDAIQVRGRTTILKYNYRSTRQIAEAALQPLLDNGGGDPETTGLIPVREGPKPHLFGCGSTDDQQAQIADFLKSSAHDLRLPVHVGAVIVRNNKTAEEFAEGLQNLGLPAAVVKGGSLDLDDKSIKVMTIHSAKGLEFPIVAVARVDRDLIPRIWDVKDPEDREARLTHERRLLSVGLSRAMRRLALTYDVNKPSSFIGELDRSLWISREAKPLPRSWVKINMAAKDNYLSQNYSFRQMSHKGKE